MTIEEYNDCVRLHSDAIYRFALKSTGPGFTAEDVIQDVFEKLWKKRISIEFNTSKSLLYKMVHNRIIDLHRYHKVRRADLIHIDLQTSNSETQLEVREIIEKAFAHLSEEYKSLVMLRDYEGYSYEEISQILDMSMSKVKVYLFRARKQLQTIIKSLEYAT